MIGCSPFLRLFKVDTTAMAQIACIATVNRGLVSEGEGFM